jgi:hypothetical protein
MCGAGANAGATSRTKQTGEQHMTIYALMIEQDGGRSDLSLHTTEDAALQKLHEFAVAVEYRDSPPHTFDELIEDLVHAHAIVDVRLWCGEPDNNVAEVIIGAGITDDQQQAAE